MQIGTATGLRSQVFAGSRPAWGTTQTLSLMEEQYLDMVQKQVQFLKSLPFDSNCEFWSLHQ